MKIIFPNNNHEERLYAAEILFKTLQGISFETEFAEQKNTVLTLNNGKQITIEDHFFNQYPSPKSYLSTASIPQTVNFVSNAKNAFLPENDLPILYGTDFLSIQDAEINCGCDVFAASFFCLSRWEEVVNPKKDSHGRFPASSSLAEKHGFLQRPLVNEMAEMLRNMLIHLGENLSARPHSFKFIPTHDVDLLYLWQSNFGFLKKMAGDLFKRMDLKAAMFNLSSFIKTKLQKQPDPYDTYDYLMDISERYGFTSHFFFLAGGKSKFDNNMEEMVLKAKPILDKIHARGHRIGVHPSYHSADDGIVFEKEIERFRQISPQSVLCGRQHFLRFDVLKTWRFWEKNGLEWDSTLGYPEKSGFRCGICNPFPVFDLMERKKLGLLEIPLTAMEATYPVYQKASPEVMEADLLSLLNTVKKYRGSFVLLWHNSSFDVPTYRAYAPIYERILEAAANASS